MLAYKFPLYPSKDQQKLLWKSSCMLNNLYNYFIDLEIKAHKAKKPLLTQYELNNLILAYRAIHPDLKEINAQVVQQVSYRIACALTMFKKDHNDFPTFRSCKYFFNIHYPQSGYSIQKNLLHTKIYGDIKMRVYRKLEGTVKQITIHCDVKNHWYVCIMTDKPKQHKDVVYQDVGVDMGISNLIATSDGEVVPKLKHIKYFDDQIDKLKEERKEKYKKKSKNYQHLSLTIRRLYGAKTRKTNDALHKVSHHLSTTYDTIYIEDLDVKTLSEGQIRGLNRELRNSGLGTLRVYLDYKSNRLVKVNPYKTSMLCCMCGREHKMPLYQRTMKCECGNRLDRDTNASFNILHLGRSISKRCYAGDANITEINPRMWMDVNNPLLAWNKPAA